MPSPFPGMDPYLEGEMWQEFHQTFAGEIRAQLLAKLPPRYTALLAKRNVISQFSPTTIMGVATGSSKKVVYPDVHVSEIRRVSEAMATYDITEPVLELISPFEEEVPIVSVEVRDVANRTLVTAIEILSPVNKHGAGWREYDEKRRALLKTRTHLLELDLLRGGERILLEGEWPPAPYYYFLSRWQRRPVTEVYAVQLRRPLRSVPVPLLPPDADVTLDMQAALDACFALVHYERLLDYDEMPPQPEFSAEDLGWVRERCQRMGNG